MKRVTCSARLSVAVPLVGSMVMTVVVPHMQASPHRAQDPVRSRVWSTILCTVTVPWIMRSEPYGLVAQPGEQARASPRRSQPGGSPAQPPGSVTPRPIPPHAEQRTAV